jgi:DNA-binding beta-propeller fold protein YncE
MQRLGEEGIDSIQQISVIETNTNTVIGSPIPVESFPSVIAYDPVNE